MFSLLMWYSVSWFPGLCSHLFIVWTDCRFFQGVRISSHHTQIFKPIFSLLVHRNLHITTDCSRKPNLAFCSSPQKISHFVAIFEIKFDLFLSESDIVGISGVSAHVAVTLVVEGIQQSLVIWIYDILFVPETGSRQAKRFKHKPTHTFVLI